MLVRQAKPTDCVALRELRNFYINHSFASPTTEPSTLEQTEAWFARFTQTGASRLLVAIENGKLVGVATSSPYDLNIPAYGSAVITGICLDPQCQGRGVGTALYGALLNELIAAGFNSVVVNINLPNNPSIALHRKLGFKEVGVLKEMVAKQGQVHDMLLMQRMLQQP